MLPEKRWFYACVEDVNDPDQNGRIAIRIAGVHTQDKTLLPTEYLPWAKCLMPVTNASSVGLGASPTGVTVGTWIEGYALDDAYQECRACWVWNGANPVNGADTNPLALGQVVQAVDRQQYNAVEGVPVKDETDNPAEPTPEPDSTDPQTWMTVATGEIGVKEYVGKFNNNPRIIEYHKTTTLGASEDEVSWCAAFVGWCLIKAGLTSTKSALARSYINWGVGLSAPKFGAVVVFRRGNNPTFGHVGFVQKFDANYIYCLGGNQSDSVKISRFPRSSVLGYRWPANVSTAAAAPAQKNGTWSEPIPNRTPVPATTPAPSGNIQDSDVTGETVVPTQGGSKYPYNIPYASRSGHIIEIDDTPGGERLHWLHMSGSYKQMLADGDVVNKSIKDHYDIVQQDRKVAIGGDHNVTVTGTQVRRTVGADYAVYQAQKSTVVQGPMLQKAAGTSELHAAVHRVISDMIEMSGTLRIPRIEVDTLLANNMEVANTINGNIKYAEGAGKAPVKAGATPATSSGAGSIDIKSTLNDTGGNFDRPIEGDSSASSTSSVMAAKMVSSDASSSQTSSSDAEPTDLPMSFPFTSQLPSAALYPDKVIILRQTGAKPQMMMSNGTTWESVL